MLIMKLFGVIFLIMIIIVPISKIFLLILLKCIDEIKEGVNKNEKR